MPSPAPPCWNASSPRNASAPFEYAHLVRQRPQSMPTNHAGRCVVSVMLPPCPSSKSPGHRHGACQFPVSPATTPRPDGLPPALPCRRTVRQFSACRFGLYRLSCQAKATY